jgi:uncharacterized protein with ParB-like and HNH nuclease domain
MAENWYEDYTTEDDEFEIDEYELTATPNDFNVLTINSFIESGAIKIPGFQRNYVWDIKRASKLIESLILGLPVPQIFLYEEARNRFLVIDGQQRLMSIYYFIRQRFPRKEKRSELRAIFDKSGRFPDEVIFDDSYFGPFKLSLPDKAPNKPNKFKGLSYGTLGDYKGQFDLRPVRNVIVKQNTPSDDDSSVFEMFNRLNTGGINLRAQEIRISLYHSSFYDMLYRLNLDPRWRRVLNVPDPDVHMKDVEVILRGFAMLIEGANYRPSMAKFLNEFSRHCRANSEEKNTYLEQLFTSFLSASEYIPADTFVSSRTRRFSIALYEAAFTALFRAAFDARELFNGVIDAARIRELDLDPQFVEASEKASADTSNVALRLSRARAILG